MIRYVVKLPGDVSQEAMHHLRDMLTTAANDKEWRDIVMSAGATIEDLRPSRRRPAIVRRAMALAR